MFFNSRLTFCLKDVLATDLACISTFIVAFYLQHILPYCVACPPKYVPTCCVALCLTDPLAITGPTVVRFWRFLGGSGDCAKDCGSLEIKMPTFATVQSQTP